MKKILILPFVLFLHQCYGQLIVDNAITPEEAVATILGEGIIATNITFSGAANQIGTFNSEAANVGINTGLIMGTGDVINALGPNSGTSNSEGGGFFGASDPDIDDLDGLTHNDAAILEFDFIATGDTVTFKYVWASDEYPEFSGAGSCGNVSDVFGFFLSGPGISGPFTGGAENIALIPGSSDFVSIFNLNAGCDGQATPGDSDCNYCEYYIFNGDDGSGLGTLPPYSTTNTYIEYDGLTVVLTAVAALQCGQTYHIKLVLADVSDTAYDSAVFIEENSFSSNGAVNVAIANPPIPDWPSSTMAEGCIYGAFEVFEDDPLTLDTLVMSYGGTATNGVDFAMVSDTIFIPIGQLSVVVDVVPVEDGITEGTETFTISFPFYNACNELDTAFAEVQIVEQLPIALNPLPDLVLCLDEVHTVTLNASDGFEPFHYAWNTGDTTSTIVVDAYQVYEVSVTDFCGQEETESFEVTPPASPTMTVDPEELFICPGASESATANPVGGSPPYQYQWTGSSSTSATAAFQFEDEGFQYVTVIDDCGSMISDSVLITVPSPLVLDSLREICINSNTGPFVSGGTTPYYYYFDSLAFSLSPADFLVGHMNGDYEVTVVDACGQSASMIIEVHECDTFIPNIFTPNGDGDNDTFIIRGGEDFPNSLLSIFNRWGNLVYDNKNYTSQWGGEDSADGTYFYIYDRSDGKSYHGWVQLMRDK